MTYIETIPPEKAEGKLRELYDNDVEQRGYVSNYTRAQSLRPEVAEGWNRLRMAITAHMDVRLYELVTVAAASTLRCSY